MSTTVEMTEAYQRAVSAVLAAMPTTEEQAASIVEAITDLVLTTIRASLEGSDHDARTH